MNSVKLLKHIVRKIIATEITAHRVAGPFENPPFLDFRISPLEILPKKEPNKFRVIHHLLFPEGKSLNDQIPEEMCSVEYASFEDAIKLVRKLGPNALLAKTDVKSAFRLSPIHPNTFNSLGFYFEGQYYFNKCLPVGCSLSCRYFEAFSSFLE